MSGPSLAGDASIDFGTVAVRDAVPLNYSFSNSGSAATEPISLGVIDGGMFVITSVGCANVPLNPTASCVVRLSAVPSQLGIETGVLFIDGGAGARLSVGLSVQGIAPLAVAPDMENFGNVQTGSESFRSFRVSNFSTQDLPITPNATSPDFSVTDGGTCTGQVPGKSHCTVEVRFVPGGTGPHTGTLEIVTGVTSSLSGNGRALEFDQTDADFGVVDAGASVTTNLVLSNTGGSPSGQIAFSIPNASAFFSFDAGGCTSGLDGGAACPVSVTFRPQGPGDKLASLEASYGSDVTILQLRGTGRVQWTLTVRSDGGTVSFDQPSGATCPSDCVHRYDETSSPPDIQLSEMANPGMELSGWTGCQQVSGGCSVTMDADRVVTANFVPLTPRLILSVEDGGTAAPVPGGTMCGAGCYDYQPGTSVTASANALRGWVFGGFTGACMQGTCQLVMNGPRSVGVQFNGPPQLRLRDEHHLRQLRALIAPQRRLRERSDGRRAPPAELARLGLARQRHQR